MRARLEPARGRHRFVTVLSYCLARAGVWLSEVKARRCRHDALRPKLLVAMRNPLHDRFPERFPPLLVLGASVLAAVLLISACIAMLGPDVERAVQRPIPVAVAQAR